MEVQNIDKIREALEYMKPFFDVVRLVDTKKTKVMVFDSQGKDTQGEHRCYKVWNKEKRCENCTSMKALLTHEPQEKYEFKGEDVYHVISRPIKVVDALEEEHEVAIEIVNGVSDQSIFEKLGMHDTDNRTIIELIAETYRKIYEDPLTEVYNRRFLDEFRFLYHNHNQVAKQVAFIMVDLKKFKEINDTMGHETGDRLLTEVAHTLQKNVRVQDAIIRMGGDEFLIVLIDRRADQIEEEMQKIHKQVKNISIETLAKNLVDIDWGYSYTATFEATKKYTLEMLRAADQAMYEMKNNNQ